MICVKFKSQITVAATTDTERLHSRCMCACVCLCVTVSYTGIKILCYCNCFKSPSLDVTMSFFSFFFVGVFAFVVDNFRKDSCECQIEINCWCVWMAAWMKSTTKNNFQPSIPFRKHLHLTLQLEWALYTLKRWLSSH